MRSVFTRNTLADTSHEFYISEMMGKRIYDQYGHKIGRIKDLVAVWTTDAPRVVGVKFASAAEIIPVDLIAEFGKQGIYLKKRLSKSHVRPIADQEVFVNRWLLDKQIVDIAGSKVVRVNDIKLRWEKVDNQIEIWLLAVDIGFKGMFRRLGLSRLSAGSSERLLDWGHFKPLRTRTANLELTIPVQDLARMHPADIADILENLTQDEQARIITSLDKETAADALVEVEAEARTQLLENMNSHEASLLVQEMDPDDAADVLSDLSQDKSAEILKLMTAEEAQEVAELMSYPEGTAGSLMNTDLVAVPADWAISKVLEVLKDEEYREAIAYQIFVVDQQEHLMGTVHLRDLITSESSTLVKEVMQPIVRLTTDDGFDRVLENTVKYDLLAIPVVDQDDKLAGVITVDDVLTSLLVDRHNRRYLEEFSYLSLFRTLRKK